VPSTRFFNKPHIRPALLRPHCHVAYVLPFQPGSSLKKYNFER